MELVVQWREVKSLQCCLALFFVDNQLMGMCNELATLQDEIESASLLAEEETEGAVSLIASEFKHCDAVCARSQCRLLQDVKFETTWDRECCQVHLQLVTSAEFFVQMSLDIVVEEFWIENQRLLHLRHSSSNL